jgi:hypothetical protein
MIALGAEPARDIDTEVAHEATIDQQPAVDLLRREHAPGTDMLARTA